MSTSFLTKKTIFGIIALLILMAGLAGGVYLSQRQTQLKSQAAFACSCAPNADYGDLSNKAQWCGCAAQCNDTGSLTDQQCPQAPQSNTCANSCGACPLTTTCGQNTYDQCDTSPCRAAGATASTTFTCRASGNPNSCSGQYSCGSCFQAPAGGSSSGGSSGGGSSTSGSTNTDSAICNQPQFYEGSSVAPFLVAGRTYNARITIQNNGNTTWTAGNGYKLGFPTSGDSWSSSVVNGNDWTISWPNSRDARLPVNGSIAPGQSATFNVNVTPRTDAAAQSKFFWRMIKEGSAWFGSACETYVSITPASSDTGSGTGIGAGGTANPDDGSKCETPQANLIDPKTGTKVPYVLSNTKYTARLVMLNTGESTWKADQYTLVPDELTKTTWLANPVPLKRDIARGSQAVFDVPVQSPATPDGEHLNVGYYFRLANNGVQFGAACQPEVVDITPKPADEAPVGTTACFVMSESLTDVSAVTTCDDATGVSKGIIHQYTAEPTTVPYTLQDDIVGIKTVYVRFISTTGEIKDINKQISFSPGPVLDIVACTHSATGQGTLVGIRGQNFGAHRQQGAGYVKVGDQNATITSWNGSTNTIIANVPTRLEGEQSIELKLDDGRTVLGKCNVGISTVSFTVNTQCTIPGSFNATGVDVRIQEATSGAKPILSKKISINKGQPMDFAPSIETGKKYSLIIKAPETLARKVEFVADEGSKNLGEIKLWIGDIAPRVAPDGKINTLDKSEMSKQWSLLETTAARSADLNKDGTVNSHDYSCQKLGFNQQDEAIITPSQSN